ncbi:MAG: TIGR04438 family Trp-rich protein [Rubrivivax sp.]
MPLVAIGALLVILKLMEIDPVTGWSWWWILAPFGAALAWWIYADTTGLTQRRAIKRLEERKVARRERDMAALGLKVDSDRRKRASKDAADEAREQARERARNRKGER